MKYQPAQIKSEVIRVLRVFCGLGDKPITGEDRLQEELGLDSVQLLSLALEVENSFQIYLGEEPDSPPRTINDLVELVSQRLVEKEHAE